MIQTFVGESADDVWRAAAHQLLTGDGLRTSDSRLGPTREIPVAVFQITDPKQRWILSRKPGINPAFAIAEVIWILQGRNDAQFLNFWNPILPKFAGNGEIYTGAYGHRLRQNLNMDQIGLACRALEKDKYRDDVVLQIWDSKLDLGTGHPDVPCNVCSMLKIRNDKLEWTQVMRSNDCFLGTPHNFVQFTSLQEMMAGRIGVEVGSYTHISRCLHLYLHDMKRISISPDVPDTTNPDLLGLPEGQYQRVLAFVGWIMDALCSPDLTRAAMHEVTSAVADLPLGWKNMVLIAAADSARRRHMYDYMDTFADTCTNPVLTTAWHEWRHRQAL